MARNRPLVVSIEPPPATDVVIREDVALSTRNGLHWHFVERAAIERVDSQLRTLIEIDPDGDYEIIVRKK